MPAISKCKRGNTMAMKKKLIAWPKLAAVGLAHCGFTSPAFVQCSLPVDHSKDLPHRFNGLPDAEFIQVTLAQDCSLEELLAVGDARDTGVLALLSRHELQQIAPETIDLDMPKDDIVKIARFHMQRAWRVKHHALDEELATLDDNARYWILFTITNHLAAQAAATEKKYKRRNTMNAATDEVTLDTVEGTVTKKGKKAAKKAAKVPAKAAKVAKKATAAAKVPADDANKAEIYGITVVATNKETKEGTFFATLQKFAAKPIKMETLIQKLIKELEGTLRSEKPVEHVVRVRTRDSFNRLGFLKAAKA